MQKIFILFLLLLSCGSVTAHELDQQEMALLKQALQADGILYDDTPMEFARHKLYFSLSIDADNIEPPQIVAAKPSFWRVIVAYIKIGFKHIVPKGPDHILFVLGLFLFSSRFKYLFYQITAFTLAHSITLALSVYQVVELPMPIVEALIALSIVYIALENIWFYKKQHVLWRPIMVFIFGLLHGLGFASVLMELGLPQQWHLTGLLGFNIGVELGQLMIVLIAWLLLHWFQSCNWYRNRIIIPCSLVIASVAVYWVLERVGGLFTS